MVQSTKDYLGHLFTMYTLDENFPNHEQNA